MFCILTFHYSRQRCVLPSVWSDFDEEYVGVQGVIDMDTFNQVHIVSSQLDLNVSFLVQLLELDEDDTNGMRQRAIPWSSKTSSSMFVKDFSKGMAWAYFSQVDTTFDDMDSAL